MDGEYFQLKSIKSEIDKRTAKSLYLNERNEKMIWDDNKIDKAINEKIAEMKTKQNDIFES